MVISGFRTDVFLILIVNASRKCRSLVSIFDIFDQQLGCEMRKAAIQIEDLKIRTAL